MNVARARTVLESALAERVFPAAVVEVGSSADPVWTEAFGRLSYDDEAPAASLETVFDLASLTKVIVAASVAMRLVERDVLSVEQRVGRFLPAWSAGVRARVTVRDLLEHCTGLPAWRALFVECRGLDAFVGEIGRLELSYEPRSRSIYSDLGFILLGHVLELAGAAPLDRQFAEIIEPVLGDPRDRPLVFRPDRTMRRRSAPTQVDDWRGRLLCGEVDDQNAWALGGVAAHAGLFGTAAAVGAFARAMMRALAGTATPGRAIAGRETLQAFVTPSSVPGSSRALAWDTMRPSSSCGSRMSAQAVGHTGFTGTSLWIDPLADTYVVLLTNRVHPRAADQPIQDVRRAVHDALMDGPPV